MRKLPSRKLLGAIIAGVLLLPETAFTLGLGEIEVNSALNQKLKADIELLSATPEDTENLIVKLASRKEFTRAGLDRPYLLNDLRFNSVVVDGVPQIKVSSGSPIREPFLNFLVEVDWPNGHLIREYTVLLDPPVFMTQPASAPPAPVKQNDDFRPVSTGSSNVIPVVSPGVSLSARPGAAATAPVSQPAVRPAEATSNTPAFVPAPYVQQPAVVNQKPGTYRIKSGDTAWSLADAMRPDQSISVEQMMVAMLRANPESFIDENVNGLKRGYILRVPDYDQIVAVNQADARAMVREQAALWRQYQQTHAGGQPASAMPGEGVADADGGAVAESENDAYLEIVSAGSGASTTAAKDPAKMSAQELRAELALARERVETERVEKEALQRRIEALEQSVGKMKGMLSIEDDALSDVQALGSSAEGGSSEAEALEADIVADARAEMEESIAETEDMLAEQHLEDAIVEESLAEKAGEAGEADAVEEAAVFLDETAAEDELADAAEEAPVVSEVANEPVAPQPQFVPKPQPDPLTKLLSDPILLAAAGGGLLLILAVIALIIKRRKAAAAEEEVAAPATTDADDDLESLADEIAGETAGDDEAVAESLAGDSDLDKADENLDPDATMILDATEDTLVAEDSLEAVEEEEPRDDVIAEADVYLAYGIYQQAEELLTQAIAENPERDDYRVKLAETHYASKNTDAFIDVATDIKKRAGDEITPSWKKVMVMGQDMCADNALFQGSMVGGLDVDSLAPKAPEMDFDLGLDTSDEAAPDLDLSLDDEPLELPEMDELEAVADEAESAEKEKDEEIDDDETLVAPAGELEFDLSDTGAVEETPAEEDEFSLDIDASELDIDIQEEVEEEVIDLMDELQDVGDVDIDFGLDEETPATDESSAEADADADADEVATEDDVAAVEGTAEEVAVAEEVIEEAPVEEEIEIDLTEEAEAMDLDLDADVEADSETASDAETEEETSPAPAAGNDFADDEDDFDLSSLDDVDEVSTKLDLARAYLDMGDHEGTRGILEEVIAEGNDEQKKEASELMSQLDS